MHSPTATILLVEDDRPTRTFLADNLAADGYEILEAATYGEGSRQLATFPDLVVLDLGLPDRDGLQLLEDIRGADRADRIDPELPLLVLSGRSGELHRLRGFARGCDDYLIKPFGYPELHARILALLRRTKLRSATGRVRVGPLELDPVSRGAWVNGERLPLSKKEFALLSLLAAEPTRVFTREELLRDVWGFRTPGVTRTLDAHACRLRAKLRSRGTGFLVNVWGVGYRLMDGQART